MADNQPAPPASAPSSGAATDSGSRDSARTFNGRGGGGGGRGRGNDRKRKFNNNGGRGDSNSRGKGWGGGRGGGRNNWRKDGQEDAEDGERKGEAPVDRRTRTQMWQQKRRKVDEDGNSTPAGGEPSYMRIQFSEAEIAAEERRPKRKVAVLIGYAGTGYHGLQINHKEKTIEGDIFAAFVAAGAIAKTNADDPRKTSFVRCARTDKGVHAAGNMISLKLIIEDPEIVSKINEQLPPQIRIWGITRTNNAFSSYQACDSRWYEYLMPSYCLLPPHPHSFIGKKVADYAKEKGTEEELAKRMEEVGGFWEEVEKNEIQPILDSLDASVRDAVLRKLQAVRQGLLDADGKPMERASADQKEAEQQPKEAEHKTSGDETAAPTEETTQAAASSDETAEAPTIDEAKEAGPSEQVPTSSEVVVKEAKPVNPVDQALKRINSAYIAAKRRYHVTPGRLAQLQEALDQYVGTRNYHNYTVQKRHDEASAKRLIKSFAVNPSPVTIGDTEWLSLKVHGQSFMMHQIRKMVGMAVLVTRCGTSLERIHESYGPTRISIPKAPGLGLLLERPVFDNYNARVKEQSANPLDPLDFGLYEKEIQKFKEEQIYQRIFQLEEQQNSFHTFLHQVDNFKSDYFLWVTAGGLDAAHKRVGIKEDIPTGLADDDDEGDDAHRGGEGNEG